MASYFKPAFFSILLLSSFEKVFGIICFDGVTFNPSILPPDLKAKNCSSNFDMCRITTVSYGPPNSQQGFMSHTSYSCDRQRMPCDVWCQLELTVDENIKKCETFCCHYDYCNSPILYQQDDVIREVEEPVIDRKNEDNWKVGISDKNSTLVLTSNMFILFVTVIMLYFL